MKLIIIEQSELKLLIREAIKSEIKRFIEIKTNDPFNLISVNVILQTDYPVSVRLLNGIYGNIEELTGIKDADRNTLFDPRTITARKFLSLRNMGYKSWREFIRFCEYIGINMEVK